MESFSVELDQSLGVYLPGQNVSGYIQFQLTTPESFKGMFGVDLSLPYELSSKDIWIE